MYVLGVDTSTDHAICFLADQNAQVYSSVSEPHDRDLSARLYPIIDRLLMGAGIELTQVEVFAAGIGPGSFTGVRIAVTTLRTLALVTGKRLVAVSTLDTLALSAMESSSIGNRDICAVLPSRRNEVYAAYYRNGIIAAPAVTVSYSNVVRALESPILAGSAPLIDAIFEASSPGTAAGRIDIESLNPASFAALAAKEIAAGRFQDPLTLDPLYIAPPAVSQHKSIVTQR
jgi:tRNA threonylcarbamoyladenosine biosynthesis protein TsaB